MPADWDWAPNCSVRRTSQPLDLDVSGWPWDSTPRCLGNVSPSRSGRRGFRCLRRSLVGKASARFELILAHPAVYERLQPWEWLSRRSPSGRALPYSEQWGTRLAAHVPDARAMVCAPVGYPRPRRWRNSEPSPGRHAPESPLDSSSGAPREPSDCHSRGLR